MKEVLPTPTSPINTIGRRDNASARISGVKLLPLFVDTGIVDGCCSVLEKIDA